MSLNLSESYEKNYDFDRDYPSEILTQVTATYPFLNDNEREDFLFKATQIDEPNPVLEIRKMLELLNNPHASIKSCPEDDSVRMFELNPDERPTGEMINNVLYMNIPTFSGVKLDNLEEAFLPYEKSSSGIIIDLRENGGGQGKPGWEFTNKYFINKGNHSIGVYKEIKPEGELKTIQASVQSENTPLYAKPIVLLTSTKTFSSAETFVSILRASSNSTVIGTETKGGSAYPIQEYIKINNVNYRVSIPTCRFFLPGETEPLEQTKIKPDIYYDGEDIVKYSIEYIKQIIDANEEGERTKVTENVLKIAKEIDPENKLSGLDLVEEVCRYVRTMVPSQEMLNEAWKSKIISKKDKWDTSADELLSQENLIPGHSRIRNIDGCTQEAYITRALLLAKGIPSLMVDTIEEKWLNNNPNWKNDGIVTVSGHYFLDVYITADKKWYTINPGNREERVHEHKDYSIGNSRYIEFAKGRDTADMGYKNMEERLNKLEYSINS